MRKLSMKKAGTPAIDDDSDSGSGGVSADGCGALLPRLGVAVAAPFSPAAPPAVDLPCASPAPVARDGLALCALCLLTCGATKALLVLGAVAGAGVVSPAGATVEAGVDGVVASAAAVVVGWGAGAPAVASAPVVEGVVSSAEEAAGASSASSVMPASSSARIVVGRGSTRQFPSR